MSGIGDMEAGLESYIPKNVGGLIYGINKRNVPEEKSGGKRDVKTIVNR